MVGAILVSRTVTVTNRHRSVSLGDRIIRDPAWTGTQRVIVTGILVAATGTSGIQQLGPQKPPWPPPLPVGLAALGLGEAGVDGGADGDAPFCTKIMTVAPFAAVLFAAGC